MNKETKDNLESLTKAELIAKIITADVVFRAQTRSLHFGTLRGANATRKAEWHSENTEEWTLLDWSNELAGETGEACNVVKKIRRITTGVARRGPKSEEELLEALKKEVADVVICADLLAMQAGFSLGDAVRDKFNETSAKHRLTTFIP